ncbi:MAG TPA: hypothetical protein VE465_06200 [Streptosporangiaceae bacterium]|nr:hypothetical protein [Streptosporangiaceae bacterium]
MGDAECSSNVVRPGAVSHVEAAANRGGTWTPVSPRQRLAVAPKAAWWPP